MNISQDLNDEVMNALIDFFKYMGNVGQAISSEFGLNGSDGMALLKIDEPVSMKELSQRLGCDASFVTAVADSLERHGLAKREPSLRDRRSKNIVLTEHGAAVRDQFIAEVTARMPWSNALDASERECFLGHLRKMSAKGGDRVTPAAAASS